MKMKATVSSFAVILLVFLFAACSKSADPTPSSQVPLKLAYVESQNGDKAYLQYDNTGKVSNITADGTSQAFNIYYLTTGDIQGAVNGTNPKSIKDPTLNKDANAHVYNVTVVGGNPVLIKAIQKNYTFDPNTFNLIITWVEVVVKVTYDTKINPMYLVLEQSGMIPSIDQLVLASPNPLYSALQANGLLARNNPVKVEAFDNKGNLLEPATTISYQYNPEGLPTVAISSQGTKSSVAKFNYVKK